MFVEAGRRLRLAQLIVMWVLPVSVGLRHCYAAQTLLLIYPAALQYLCNQCWICSSCRRSRHCFRSIHTACDCSGRLFDRCFVDYVSVQYCAFPLPLQTVTGKSPAAYYLGPVNSCSVVCTLVSSQYPCPHSHLSSPSS